MGLTRFLKHLRLSPRELAKRCPKSTLSAIEAAIAASEKEHRGEIVFALEPWLGLGSLMRNKPIRERAVDVFSRLRVWDTEENNGVLLFLSLAEKRVEIVADRAVERAVPSEYWAGLAGRIKAGLVEGNLESAVILGIQEITDKLRELFPEIPGGPNQLPDEPMIVS